MEKAIEKFLKKGWYIQGFNAVPIYIMLAAVSGFTMRKKLGFGYQVYTFNFKNKYGEMGYLEEDFRRIWRIIKRKLKINPDYLTEMKKLYDDEFKDYENIFEKIDRINLKNLAEKGLVCYFKTMAEAQIAAIGISHLVDSIGNAVENEFRKMLYEEISDKKELNNYFLELTKPKEPSFLLREERELKAIAKLRKNRQASALKEHQRKYFWIQNSYAGPKEMTLKDFENKLKMLRRKNPGNIAGSRLKRKFSAELLYLGNIISFSTVWQDRRKGNALKSVSYLAKIIKEIAHRSNITAELLQYLSPKNISQINSFEDLKFLKKELKNRSQGVFFVLDAKNEIVFSGREYKKLMDKRKKFITKGFENEIHGISANKGTAIGKIIVIKDLLSLKKVKLGEILVTSMTRPEFLPALKKVAGIITDEGGLTCHAAIIARELDIPAVIGTKIATKVLKNGMMVELKANHGVVKILR